MNFSFKFYWSLFLRRLPVMMALFLACTTLGVITAFQLPPTFSTTARLQLEAQQIPDNMVNSTVQTQDVEQLQLVQERLMTRANLIDIAQEYQVFGNNNGLTPDEVVQKMREQTRIFRSGGRDKATLMSISFEALGGRLAANVVNAYVTLVLEDSTKQRRERAENALSFFEQEVSRLVVDIDRKSAEIINFKNENISSLPDDLAYRQNRQTLLQERVSRLEQDSATLINQRKEIIRVFEQSGDFSPTAQVTNRRLTAEESRLEQLKLELQNALAVFSDTNPKVVLLRTQVETLEKNAPVADDAIDDAEQEEGADERSAIMNVTLADLDQRLLNIEGELERSQVELARLETTITETATNSIKLERLDRELENIEGQYERALNNANQAQMSERLEVTARGQRITLIEGASVPQEPSGPPRNKIMAAGIGAGLGLAGGFFFLLEAFNRVLRRPADLQNRFGIIPLGVIPYMESRTEKVKRRTILTAAVVFVLVAVPVALNYIDKNFMPLDLLVNRVLDRLGLT